MSWKTYLQGLSVRRGFQLEFYETRTSRDMKYPPDDYLLQPYNLSLQTVNLREKTIGSDSKSPGFSKNANLLWFLCGLGVSVVSKDVYGQGLHDDEV
ncbi:hypothetical protein EVAR_90358_1 [Eumeta japonica]|uniref:Uncharacterized protein n=1 Tax=Eumeta variegata TaxID=151549 RepID=A0A4C1YCT8_EUMVA|nr:hypothetical protein EVAR_90358_1 [Eumeta japonica]